MKINRGTVERFKNKSVKVSSANSKNTASKHALLYGAVVSCLLLTANYSHAQVYANDAEWKESEVPPPPAFDVNKLVTFEVPRYTSMVYGVDLASVSIFKADSLVRYVIVITSASGAKNVMYEALRCSTGEFKTYARYSADGKWSTVADPQWRSVFAITPSLHPLWFAKAGACDGAAPVSSLSELATKLKNGAPYFAP